MATAIFTTVEARVNQALTNAIWADEIMDNVNQLAGSHRQLLVDGGFEIWQRGAGPFTLATILTADGWRTEFGSGTLTITKETVTIDGGTSSLKAVRASHAGTTQVFQPLEDYSALRGKAASFSLRVHQSVASLITIALTDSAGTTTGAASATTGAFVTLTVTRTVNAAATSLGAMINIGGNGTFYFDNAMLVIGPAPAPYQPLHLADDLARCQRYYEVHGGGTGPPFFSAYGAAGATCGASVQFAVTKGGIPTVTKAGTWGVVNCGQPAPSSPSTSAYVLAAVVTALGSFSYNPNSADDQILSEWNP